MSSPLLTTSPCCRYKTNRSCSALIAGDLEGGFTRAQVARRLKQLNLSRPKKGEGRSGFDDLFDGLSDDSSDNELSESDGERDAFERGESGEEMAGDLGGGEREVWEDDRAVGDAEQTLVTERVHQLMRYGEGLLKCYLPVKNSVIPI
jgi:hypothetical protein